MKMLQPGLSIVPIVRVTPDMPVSEVLGTGFFVGKGKKSFIITAKHVFQTQAKNEKDKYAYVIARGTQIEIWPIKTITAAEGYDIAVCEIEHMPEAVPLSFSMQLPALNDDVFCYEYSSTRFERKPLGGWHVSFEPLAHKGNIMRYYESTYPESHLTPSFLTSFPALQGASGAPVIASTKDKQLFVAGMIVANKETHLLPAQIVEVQDGSEFTEKISYFLPLGKAINASLLVSFLQGLNIDLDMVE